MLLQFFKISTLCPAQINLVIVIYSNFIHFTVFVRIPTFNTDLFFSLGERCEIDIESKKYTQCPKNICRHPSRCAPLIQGGIRCEICPSREGGCTECQMLEHQTKFCELRTRSFPNGSFLLFPSLKHRHRFQIRLRYFRLFDE